MNHAECNPLERNYRLAAIVAMARHRVIGVENRLPWHLPEDLKRFREMTNGCAVIMGRKTYESLGRPLPGRLNIIVTRQPRWKPTGIGVDFGSQLEGTATWVAHSLKDAIEMARGWFSEACREKGRGREIFVLGGNELFQEALPLVDRLYLTEIDREFKGDAFFPECDSKQFKTVREGEWLTSQAEGGLRYRFVDFEK